MCNAAILSKYTLPPPPPLPYQCDLWPFVRISLKDRFTSESISESQWNGLLIVCIDNHINLSMLIECNILEDVWRYIVCIMVCVCVVFCFFLVLFCVRMIWYYSGLWCCNFYIYKKKYPCIVGFPVSHGNKKVYMYPEVGDIIGGSPFERCPLIPWREVPLKRGVLLSRLLVLFWNMLWMYVFMNLSCAILYTRLRIFMLLRCILKSNDWHKCLWRIIVIKSPLWNSWCFSIINAWSQVEMFVFEC